MMAKQPARRSGPRGWRRTDHYLTVNGRRTGRHITGATRHLAVEVPIALYDRFRDAADDEAKTYAELLALLLDERDDRLGVPRGGLSRADQVHPLHVPRHPVSGYPGASHGHPEGGA